MEKFIVIGDIHGCLDPLKEVVEKTRKYTDYKLVFLGDYIDRGNESNLVINYLKEIEAVFLIGNHETMLFDAMDCFHTNWEKNGFLLQKEISFENYLWLKENCQLFLNAENYYFSHAGLNPEKNLQDQDLFDLTWSVYEDPYPGLSNKIVIHGHIIVDEPMIKGNNININTGCGTDGGYLTALVLPQMEIINSHKVYF